METGRVISRRYLLQRLIKQTSFCSVYQGTDQALQRGVAVKSITPAYASAYRTAVKMTANFSHPNIVGLYDLVIDGDSFYLVQEYVEGSDFNTLLQSQLSPFEVADMGAQICLALMYAGSSSRRVCHGDLSPAAVVRDATGLVRLNNFALPTDMAYFQAWSILGGEGIALTETELAWGQQSDARRADDTRAVGLLLYQLLAGRQTGSMAVEPPADGRLRFMRNVPAELCEAVARAVVRQHPQNIRTPEAFYAILKSLAEALEPPMLTPTTANSPQPYEEPVVVRQYSPAQVNVGKLVTALPTRDTDQAGAGLSAYSGPIPVQEIPNASPTVADVSVKLAAARQAAHPELAPARERGKTSPAVIILLIGLLAFALFFVIGYFAGHLLIH